MITCKSCLKEKDEDCFELAYTPTNYRRKVCRICRNLRRKSLETRTGLALRDYNLKRMYKIDLNQFNQMIESQQGTCAICKKIGLKRKNWSHGLVVDHSHKTGQIRKLLCDKCNKGLGQFDDNPELLIQASKYLMEFLP